MGFTTIFGYIPTLEVSLDNITLSQKKGVRGEKEKKRKRKIKRASEKMQLVKGLVGRNGQYKWKGRNDSQEGSLTWTSIP